MNPPKKKGLDLTALAKKLKEARPQGLQPDDPPSPPSPNDSQYERVYHGGRSIGQPADGFAINLSRGRLNLDFNPQGQRAFYTTASHYMARDWALQKKEPGVPVVHRYRVPIASLNLLRQVDWRQRLNYTKPDPHDKQPPQPLPMTMQTDEKAVADWEEEVAVNRGVGLGTGTAPDIDVERGPILANPEELAAGNRAIWLLSHDQTAFLSASGVRLLNASYRGSEFFSAQENAWRRVPRVQLPAPNAPGEQQSEQLHERSRPPSHRRRRNQDERSDSPSREKGPSRRDLGRNSRSRSNSHSRDRKQYRHDSRSQWDSKAGRHGKDSSGSDYKSSRHREKDLRESNYKSSKGREKDFRESNYKSSKGREKDFRGSNYKSSTRGRKRSPGSDSEASGGHR